jgi:hypothetical protein
VRTILFIAYALPGPNKLPDLGLFESLFPAAVATPDVVKASLQSETECTIL